MQIVVASSFDAAGRRSHQVLRDSAADIATQTTPTGASAVLASPRGPF